mmetsp:Transcript_46365/g.97440  ORF Transcript_46365/g.97440 Transcript_46365/m.97440 type:complete len:558 (-) Transcript_46365:276-1949(-)
MLLLQCVLQCSLLLQRVLYCVLNCALLYRILFQGSLFRLASIPRTHRSSSGHIIRNSLLFFVLLLLFFFFFLLLLLRPGIRSTLIPMFLQAPMFPEARQTHLVAPVNLILATSLHLAVPHSLQFLHPLEITHNLHEVRLAVSVEPFVPLQTPLGTTQALVLLLLFSLGILFEEGGLQLVVILPDEGGGELVHVPGRQRPQPLAVAIRLGPFSRPRRLPFERDGNLHDLHGTKFGKAPQFDLGVRLRLPLELQVGDLPGEPELVLREVCLFEIAGFERLLEDVGDGLAHPAPLVEEEVPQKVDLVGLVRVLFHVALLQRRRDEGGGFFREDEVLPDHLLRVAVDDDGTLGGVLGAGAPVVEEDDLGRLLLFDDLGWFVLFVCLFLRDDDDRRRRRGGRHHGWRGRHHWRHGWDHRYLVSILDDDRRLLLFCLGAGEFVRRGFGIGGEHCRATNVASPYRPGRIVSGENSVFFVFLFCFFRRFSSLRTPWRGGLRWLRFGFRRRRGCRCRRCRGCSGVGGGGRRRRRRRRRRPLALPFGFRFLRGGRGRGRRIRIPTAP